MTIHIRISIIFFLDKLKEEKAKPNRSFSSPSSYSSSSTPFLAHSEYIRPCACWRARVCVYKTANSSRPFWGVVFSAPLSLVLNWVITPRYTYVYTEWSASTICFLSIESFFRNIAAKWIDTPTRMFNSCYLISSKPWVFAK